MPFKFKLAARVKLQCHCEVGRHGRAMPHVCGGCLWLPREQGAFANQALETVVSFVELSLLLGTPCDSEVKRQFRKVRTEGEVLQGSEERNRTYGFLGKKKSQAFIFLCILSTLLPLFFFFFKKPSEITPLAFRPPLKFSMFSVWAWPGKNRILKFTETNLKFPWDHDCPCSEHLCLF